MGGGVLLAPLLMGLVVIALTWWLERQEFRVRGGKRLQDAS